LLFAKELAVSRNTKIVLVILATVGISCAVLCVAGVLIAPRLAENAFVQDPVRAKQIGTQIAEYALPSGYQELMGMDVLTTQMVVVAPRNQRGVSLILMQIKTSNVSRAQMEQQMQQAMQRQFQGGTFQQVSEEPVTIKGQSTVLTVSESQSARGTMRQATGVFSAKSGLGMIMAMGLASEWNWQLVKDFCATIR